MINLYSDFSDPQNKQQEHNIDQGESKLDSRDQSTSGVEPIRTSPSHIPSQYK